MSDAPATWRPATEETPLVRRLLIAAVLVVLALLLFAPLVAVFYEALRKGWWQAIATLAKPEALAKGAGAAIASLGNRDAQSAIRLTLLVAAIAVPLNAVFGIAAAWTIT